MAVSKDQTVNFAETFGLTAVSGLFGRSIGIPFECYAASTPWFKGYVSINARFVPSLATSFTLKEYLRPVFQISDSKKKNTAASLVENFAAGGVAGVVAHSIFYPLDSSHIRLKTDKYYVKMMGEPQRYSNLADACKKTMATEGVGGLYKGFLSSCLGMFVFRGLFFGLYDTLKPLVYDDDEDAGEMVWGYLGLAYCTSFTADFLARPFYTVSTEPLISLRGDFPYKGALDCMSKMVKMDGYKALFQGGGGSVVRGVTGACVLSVYDLVKQEYIHWRDGTKKAKPFQF